MNHTSGPWHYSSTHEGKAFDIGAEDGSNVAVVYADLFVDGALVEARANARLIAAAPEMMEALEGLMNLGAYEDGVDVTKAQHIARDAIAKAKGK